MIRLILIIFFLLLSLLAVFKAPAYYLWLTAIIVTEYPLIFVLIAAVLTGWGYWVNKYQLTGSILGIISLLLFLSPIIRAQVIGSNLRSEITKAFTGNGRPPIFPGRSTFSFGRLLKSTPQLPYKTLMYAQYAGVNLSLDYYSALLSSCRHVKRPCIIVIHGGSWSSGDSKQLPELNSYLAARGYQVAAINYRLAPKYQTPAPVEDVKQAIKYLTQHADELQIDTANLVLLGRSAGAQIALLAAYTLHNQGIKGVIDFYGPADMVWGYSIPSNPLIMDSRKVMRNYIGGPYEQIPQKYVACSPLTFADSAIPTLIIHGENDVLVSPEHSRRLNLKLSQSNIRHYYLKLPWATHGFDFNMNGPGGQLSTFAVETFLNTISPITP